MIAMNREQAYKKINEHMASEGLDPFEVREFDLRNGAKAVWAAYTKFDWTEGNKNAIVTYA